MDLKDILKNNLVIDLDTLTNDKELVKDIQTHLSAIGLFKLADIDGTFDPITKAAIARFCKLVFLNTMDTGLFGATFAKKLVEFRGPAGVTNSVTFNSSGTVPDALTTALKFTLEREGGFVDHRDDLGGATNMGITQRTYNSYRISKKISTQSVKFITDAEVHDIYHSMYWNPSHAELMVLPLAVVQFDSAVLFGVGGAIKFLQESMGGTADGIFGPKTEAALQSNNTKDTALEMIDKRIIFHNDRVVRKPNQKVFLKGWLNRANDLRTFVNAL